MNKLNWEKIYNTDFIYAVKCWETCGGYCCNNFFGESLKFLEREAVSIPMSEEEYRYFVSIGGLKTSTEQIKCQKLTLLNGRSFNLFFLSCRAKGRCVPHESRPLICRIYPYFPVVNPQGDILDFDFCSLMDIFYLDPAKNHKCTLVNEESYRQKVKEQLRSTLQEIVKDPFHIFLFMACKLFIDEFRQAIGMHLDTLEDDQRKLFYQRYEKMLLLAKPWKAASFKEKINEAYNKVKTAWGHDFIPE